MPIRLATEADVETLFEIRTDVRENNLTRDELAALGVTPENVAEMLRTDSRAWLADWQGQPAAFAMADASRGTVFALFVRRGYEERGLGRALLAEAGAWLFARGWDEAWLTTGADAPGANAFYRRVGWRFDGVAENGENRYTLARPAATTAATTTTAG
jgi:GNAT superfamily N-acetyltransferase